MNDSICLRVSGLPCSGSVRLSCYSWGQSPYLCHSHMVHMLETPTNPWDTGGQSYTKRAQREQQPHECVESNQQETKARMVLDHRRTRVCLPAWVCTCAGSTVRSGCLHSHRCIHGRSWASCDTEPHFHMDSNGSHLCSLFRSNLEKRGENNRLSNYTQTPCYSSTSSICQH